MAITISNQASLDYSSCGVATRSVSNTTTTVLNGTLAISKTPYDAEYRAGQRLTFVLNVTNDTDNFDGTVTITDDLGGFSADTGAGTTILRPLDYLSYQLFVDGVLNTTAAVAVTQDPSYGVRFTITGLPADFNLLTIVYQAEVNEYADLTPNTGRIDNTAALSIAGTVTDTAQATVQVDCYADVRVEKSITPVSFDNGSNLTYTFILRNYGTASPTNVTLRDRFTPPSTAPLVSVTVNGNPVTDYSYDAATGQFAIGSEATPPYSFDIPAATMTRDPATGIVTPEPGIVTVQVVGTVNA